ncbi:hypothetical protein [Alkalibacillus haloalkaliphilus]|uniref:hypothetical protein n=1 Tax=Alkalibacillus haloalkaliphilus TaxID=94136 RepID=UPI002936325B|nr:hypothetical protein [Alkalibacillus haloalkaliphilus]MDV2583121.1 hypothetical protein [Alkalibacillus haloalkaliphilus]
MPFLSNGKGQVVQAVLQGAETQAPTTNGVSDRAAQLCYGLNSTLDEIRDMCPNQKYKLIFNG